MPITEESVREEARKLPLHMQEGAMLYVTHGAHPGSFLSAVLRNDLISVAENADEINKYALYEWAVFVYNAVPVMARGSQEAIAKWVEQGGLNGQRT